MILSWEKQVQGKDKWGDVMVSVLVRPPWQGECILVSFDRAWIWMLHGVWLFLYLSRFYSRTQIQTIAMTLCKNTRVSVSAEHLRNAISVFHALNDWKVVSRELTKNVLIFWCLSLATLVWKYPVCSPVYFCTFQRVTQASLSNSKISVSFWKYQFLLVFLPVLSSFGLRIQNNK